MIYCPAIREGAHTRELAKGERLRSEWLTAYSQKGLYPIYENKGEPTYVYNPYDLGLMFKASRIDEVPTTVEDTRNGISMESALPIKYVDQSGKIYSYEEAKELQGISFAIK